jgi:sec-independent protein translocase protein TatB
MFALIFDSVGAGEWIVLLAVILIVMGPKRLPSTLRTFGQYYAKFRRAAESFKRQLMDMDAEFQREVSKVEQEVDDAARAAEKEVDDVAKAAETPADATAASDATAATAQTTTDDGNQAS